jgi:transmembrane 9 superfamily protein 2/4
MREEDGVPIKTYERGFPVGFKAAIEEGGTEKFFLHNHVRFAILYHKDIETDLARIVGFECEPSIHSVPYTLHPTPSTLNPKP